MNQSPSKFYWHANASSGGTLSLSLKLEGEFSKNDRETAIASTLVQCYKFMKNKGYISFDAKLLSSRDIAEQFGRSRQYWEKLLSEGKILYKETSAGRITTNLWVNGYLGNKEKVNEYVRNAKKMLNIIHESKKRSGNITCAQCGEDNFQYHININGNASNTNGICRSCNFHIHQ
ncbi:hypothetical protein HYW83_03670 [Candidatus Peregrinibacteria bacterium]|nr:hypothetical protein [Candidatus Peregrinibacteria bacterium]